MATRKVAHPSIDERRASGKEAGNLAASQPSRREEYRRVAGQARETARKTREILRSATSDLQSQ